MNAGLAITRAELDRAGPLLDLSVESAGTAAGRLNGDTVLLSGIEWIDDEDYEVREPLRLAVRSTGWVPAMTDAARAGEVPVFVHTHPGGPAFFSDADDAVDVTIGTELARVTGCPTVVSVVLGGTARSPQVAMRRVVEGQLGPRESVRIAGTAFGFQPPPSAVPASVIFDRQDRAYGPEGRAVLEALTVGVVGAGGTGSPTHEQLYRLGVGRVISIDDDVVTEPTPTRTYGTGAADLNMGKVDAMARLNDMIGLGTQHVPLALNVRDPEAEAALATCDVIFGCTDGHYSRIVLNRIAYYHLIPVIDMGVLISTDAETGEITGIDQRVTVVAPGGPCLLCLGRIDIARARAENLDAAQRRALADEGYLADIDEPAPAVVAYTTMTSAYAITTMLHRLFNIGENRHTEQFIQPLLGTVRNTTAAARPGCMCSDPATWGQGFTVPRLGLG